MQPEHATRKIEAYDDLYHHADDNISEWYDGMFTKSDKPEYKGVWSAAVRYVANDTVHYNGGYYRYFCGTSDQFLVTNSDEGGNEITTTYNAADYCIGKTPEQLLEDEHGCNYIERLEVYNPYNYGSVTVKEFRDSLFAHVGIPQENVTLINDAVQITKTLEGTELHFSDCVKAICQINAVFGHISETGVFQYIALQDSAEDFSGNYKATATTYEEFSTKRIDSVRLYGNSGDVMTVYGGGKNCWSISNNFLLYSLPEGVLVEIAKQLYNAVSGITYTPVSLSALLSIFPVALGSRLTFTTHTGEQVASYVLKDILSGAQLTDQTVSAGGNEVRSTVLSVTDTLGIIESRTNAIIEQVYEKITADSAEIKVVSGNLANYKTVVAEKIQAVDAEITNIRSSSITVDNLGAKVAELGYLSVEIADLKYATVEQLNITNQTVHSIQGDYAEFKAMTTQEFAAQNGIINNLSGDFSSYKTQMSQEMIAAKGWMLEGSIGSAQIQDLDVNKLNAGTIDTARIGLASADSSLLISGSQILVNDTTDPLNPVNRVIVGKYTDADGNLEYGFLVRSADGQTVMIDGEGVHNAGITDGAIDNNKVADDANISGKKLDIRSVVEEINDGETKISQTIIQVGDKSLDIVLREQTQEISDTTERIGEIESKKMYRIETYISGRQIFTDKGQAAVMSCRVLSWDEDITAAIDDSAFFWHRESGNAESDAEWDSYHAGMQQVNITTEDVLNNASFYCEVRL